MSNWWMPIFILNNRRMMLYTKFYHSDLAIPYFFRNIIRVECLPVRATILVSFLPRGWATAVLFWGGGSWGGRRENIFLAFSQTVPHPLRRFDTHSKHLKQLETTRSAKRSIPTILWEIGNCNQSMYTDLRE